MESQVKKTIAPPYGSSMSCSSLRKQDEREVHEKLRRVRPQQVRGP